jgi:hypothetical protein
MLLLFTGEILHEGGLCRKLTRLVVPKQVLCEE